MLRLGIIGAGRIGKVHCESIGRYVKDAVVACVADPFMNAETEKTVKALGLGKIGSSNILPDNAATRGQIFKVAHLVSIEEVK